MVKDGEVIIVDTFTGRLMPGRRWSDGLHQSIEAKEGVNIRKEDQTLATITFQNYFRLYKKLSGMTGTAETEAAEFEKIYKLEIVVIPTNKPLLRIENPDVVYRTEKEKYNAVADDIARLHAAKQPVLVGTMSIEKSERLSAILQRKGVRHVVLNAKFHEREAEIVAQAGRLGMVTIATNMAGRGTDILLGGNPEFMTRQDLVKQGRARALSASPKAPSIPWPPAGFLRFYYQGQEFEVAQEPTGTQTFAVHNEAAQKEHEEVIAKPAVSSSSAPSATSHAASTTSSAAAPAARAIPAPRASISRSKTTSCASSPSSGSAPCLRRSAWKKACPSSRR